MLERCELFCDKALASESDFSPEPLLLPWQQDFLPRAETWKKQNLGQAGHSASRESERQKMQRLLIPAGDVSTLTPADLGLEELLTPSLTEQRRLEQPARMDPRCYHRATRKGEMPPLGLEENSWYLCHISSSLG